MSTLCYHPELLILDEPAAGLDPAIRQQFLQTVLERLGDEGVTVIFSSHQFSDVERLASRVGILHEGKMLKDALLNKYHDDYCKIIIDAAQRVSLEGNKDIVALKEVSGSLQVTLNVASNDVNNWAGQINDLKIMDCKPINLEDLFIDLTS